MALHYKKEGDTALTGSQKTLRKMLALLPALAVAVLCYSVTVYAWFSASIVNSGNIIQTTTYELEISMTGSDGTVVEPTNGVYTLAGSQSYTVTLTAADDGASTGYCVIRANNKTYYTAPIKKGTSFGLTIYENGDYTFAPAWGSYDSEGKTVLSDGSRIGEETESSVQPDINRLPNSEQPAESGGPSTSTEETSEAPAFQENEPPAASTPQPESGTTSPTGEPTAPSAVPAGNTSAPGSTSLQETESAALTSVPSLQPDSASPSTESTMIPELAHSPDRQ